MKRSSLPVLLVCFVITNEVSGTKSNFSSWKLLTWNTLLSTKLVRNAISELKLKCSETVDIDQAVEVLENCVRPLSNLMDGINSKIEMVKDKEDVVVAYRKYCSNMHISKECFPNLISTLSPCFKREGNATLVGLNNLVSTVTTYKCKEDRFVEYFRNDGEECFLNKTASMKKCIDPHRAEFLYSVCSMLTVRLDENLCKFIIKVEACVMSDLKKCENQAAAKFYGPLFDVISAETCSKFTRRKNVQSSAVSLKLKITVLTLFGVMINYCVKTNGLL